MDAAAAAGAVVVSAGGAQQQEGMIPKIKKVLDLVTTKGIIRGINLGTVTMDELINIMETREFGTRKNLKLQFVDIMRININANTIIDGDLKVRRWRLPSPPALHVALDIALHVALDIALHVALSALMGLRGGHAPSFFLQLFRDIIEGHVRPVERSAFVLPDKPQKEIVVQIVVTRTEQLIQQVLQDKNKKEDTHSAIDFMLEMPVQRYCQTLYGPKANTKTKGAGPVLFPDIGAHVQRFEQYISSCFAGVKVTCIASKIHGQNPDADELTKVGTPP